MSESSVFRVTSVHIDHPHDLIKSSRVNYSLETMSTLNPKIYRLVYHEVTGPVLSFLYMFHYGDIIFKDVQLTVDNWIRYKTTATSLDAILDIDGKKYSESRSIGRFLARKCNLYGSNEFETLEIDFTINLIEDMKLALKLKRMEKNPATKMFECTFPVLVGYLDRFEEQVKLNCGYFVRGKLSWADILYAAYAKMLSMTAAHDINKNHPELKKLVDKVHAHPKIKLLFDKPSLIDPLI